MNVLYIQNAYEYYSIVNNKNLFSWLGHRGQGLNLGGPFCLEDSELSKIITKLLWISIPLCQGPLCRGMWGWGLLSRGLYVEACEGGGLVALWLPRRPWRADARDSVTNMGSEGNQYTASRKGQQACPLPEASSTVSSLWDFDSLSCSLDSLWQ